MLTYATLFLSNLLYLADDEQENKTALRAFGFENYFMRATMQALFTTDVAECAQFQSASGLSTSTEKRIYVACAFGRPNILNYVTLEILLQ